MKKAKRAVELPAPSESGEYFIIWRTLLPESHVTQAPHNAWFRLLDFYPEVGANNPNPIAAQLIMCRDTGMYFEVGVPAEFFDVALKQTATIDQQQLMTPPHSGGESNQALRTVLQKMIADGAQVDVVEQYLGCSLENIESVRDIRAANQNEQPATPTGTLQGVRDLIDMFSDFFPFGKQLALIEKEITDTISQYLTPEEQSSWDNEESISQKTGWKYHLSKSQSICKSLRKALDERKFNLSVKRSYDLGEEMATCRLRRHFEHVVAKAKHQAHPLKQRRVQEQDAKLTRKMRALAELQSRCDRVKLKSPTQHLEDMANEKVEINNRKAAKWGSRRTLFNYGLVEAIKLPADTSK